MRVKPETIEECVDLLTEIRSVLHYESNGHSREDCQCGPCLGKRLIEKAREELRKHQKIWSTDSVKT